MPTTEKSPDKMPTIGWHYVRLAFCPVGIQSAHHEDSYDYENDGTGNDDVENNDVSLYSILAGDDYIFAVPALSVRLVVPPAPIVAGRLYTVDCQVDCIF